MIIFSTFLLSMFITIALIPILRSYAHKFKCMDLPNSRKVHLTPVPRVGGLAIAAGFFFPILLWANENPVVSPILAGAAVIVLFGFLDDAKGLDYKTKFGAQLIAAAIIVFVGDVKICRFGSLGPDEFLLTDYLAVPLTLVVIVGVVNAVNFADGLDGLAGGMMFFCYICLGFLAFCAEYHTITLMAVATGGAIFGFLRFNTYPATIFMGDAGSQLLGFLAITMALALSQGNTPISPFFPMLLLGLPILDTLTVMTGRMARGQSPFLADKTHLHHKLLTIGFFHSEAVFIIYLLQATLVTSAFILRFQSDWLLLVFYLTFSAVVVLFFRLAEQKQWRLKRPGVLDHLIKKQLKTYVVDRRLVIRCSQSIMEKGFLLDIVIICLLPQTIPNYLTTVTAAFFISLVLILCFMPAWTLMLLRLIVYFCVPLMIYVGEVQPHIWISDNVKVFYHIFFGLLVFFSILTLKTTSRNGGYKTTPLDFIILFVAVVFPNLPDAAVRHLNINFLAAKIIIFFFVFEVLVGELRGEVRRISMAFVAVLGGFIVKNINF